jgi:hypothetical protein
VTFTSPPDADLERTRRLDARPLAPTLELTLESPLEPDATTPLALPAAGAPASSRVIPAVPPLRAWWPRAWVGPALTLAAWLGALAVVAAAGALAWSMIRPQLGKPYVYDEAAFAFAGHAVARTGVPYSNVGHMQAETPGDFSKRFNWALWHPPLYVFTLGFAFRQWGETEQVARLVGVALNAAVALVVFAMAALLLAQRTRAAPLYAALGVALYVTNPYVIQSALLLDIDGTVLVATVALLGLAYLLLLHSTRPVRHPATALLVGLAAVCLALSLWAKMTTSLALVAAAALYRAVATRPWRPWRALVEAPLIAGAGAALFLATWSAACAATGMPFAMPFRILAVELGDAAHSTHGWRENPRVVLELVSYVALWVSPYLLLLFVWAGLARLADLVVGPVFRLAARVARRPWAGEPWGAWPIDFVLLAGGAIGAAYLIKLAASFPKYHITMMPFWAVGVAYLLSRYVPRLAWWELPVYGVVLAGMAGYFVSFVGDQQVLFRGYDFIVPLLVWPAALGLAFLVLGAALGKTHLPRQLAILGVLLTFAWSWGVDLAQSQADYSTAYNYGTAGQKETAAYLDTIVEPDEPYLASRDVAYYAKNQRFVDQDTWWEHVTRLDAKGIKVFDGHIAGQRVNVLALFLWDPTLGTIAHAYLDPNYQVVYQSGPYVVFTRWTS